MKRSILLLATMLATVVSTTSLVHSQTRSAANGAPRRGAEELARERLNAWTVGLAGGLLEGAPIRFATEIARVVDDGDGLHVLPIITRGPAENVEALLYLRGVDAAIINTDALEQFKALVPDIQQRISYILNLFPSELHVFVRPEINTLQDLAGKKVNFNTPGTAAAYSGPIIFERLGLDVQKMFLPHQLAIERMKSGDISAVVFITSKPVDAFARTTWPEGFKFLQVEYDRKFEDYYLPSSLEPTDYAQLIPNGTRVQTIAVPTVLAAYSWPRNSERYKRVARFTEYLLARIAKLQAPGFHPKWNDVNIAAAAPGLRRFPAAQEWLDRSGPATATANNAEVRLDPLLAREQVRRVAPTNRAEQERLFRGFMDWQAQRR